MAENDLISYFAEDPQMIGVLFTIALLLSQAGSVAGAALIGIYEV
jgi:hypothetical protein